MSNVLPHFTYLAILQLILTALPTRKGVIPMASTLIGRIIENDGKELGYILAAHYGTISFQHLGNFAFVATLSDGTNVTVMTSPVDEDGKQIRVEAVYDPFTMPV